MPYLSARNQPIYGTQYAVGERIPADVIDRLGVTKLNAMLACRRIRYSDDEEVRVPQPVYRDGGWWEFPNGMKVRGKKDEPPTLTEA